MPQHKPDDIVTEWLAGDVGGIVYDACLDEPEIAWQAIVRLSQMDMTDDQRALLAAGPVEDLLVWHGTEFIDRVEQEAIINPKLNYLLGGVWRREMPQAIWERIEKVRREVW
jgi:hypothetical protein